MTHQEMCDYLFKWHAPDFNFELDAEQLMHVALERGFVVYNKVDGKNVYKINEEYK